MRPSQDNTKRRLERGLSSGRKSVSTNRLFADNLPDRLRDDGDDAQVDFTAPPGSSGARDGHMHYMQQSIFSMIAAVGSRSDFHRRFEESSDSDGDGDEQPGNRQKGKDPDTLAGEQPTGRRREPESLEEKSPNTMEARGRHHRRTISDHKQLRLPGQLNQRQGKEKLAASQIGGSPRVTPPRRARSAIPRAAAPVLSRMVEAQAQLDTSSSKPTKEVPESQRKDNTQEDLQEQSASLLSTRLMEMFGFQKPEKVTVEYACSLLQSMLLQGYMYVTEGHICFYAYLPKKSTVAIKSGYLHKRGKKNPRYNRYWFSLKGDVLSYYADPSNLYFPSGHVDLRYGISASLSEKEKGKESRDFQVTTDQRTYYFRADSSANAKEWVKALQKVIFRTHNDGDSIKVSFPIENIMDVEESPMAEFAETLKIRVVDSGDTYAIDEVFLLTKHTRYWRLIDFFSIFLLFSTSAKMLSSF